MTAQIEDIKSLKLLITIVNRGMAKTIVEELKAVGLNFHVVALGRGTASSEILDLLNLSATEKEIIFTSIGEEQTETAISALQNTINLKTHGNGIAFTVPIKSIGGSAMLKMLANMLEDSK